MSFMSRYERIFSDIRRWKKLFMQNILRFAVTSINQKKKQKTLIFQVKKIHHLVISKINEINQEQEVNLSGT